MNISVIHPSRSRPKQAIATIEKWLKNAETEIEYLLCLDINDPLRRQYKAPKGVKILTNNNVSAIAAINYGAHFSTGDLLIVVSDDFDCFPGWDTALINALDGKEDFIVKTQDGSQKTLITLPLMDRKYYNRFGYVYNNGYRHMHSDQEMTAVGHLLGKVITLDLKFEHLHYTTGKTKKDEINKKNDATWNQGKKFFAERLAKNFDIKNPIMKYSDIIWH